jgi:hypothetical protein
MNGRRFWAIYGLGVAAVLLLALDHRWQLVTDDITAWRLDRWTGDTWISHAGGRWESISEWQNPGIWTALFAGLACLAVAWLVRCLWRLLRGSRASR